MSPCLRSDQSSQPLVLLEWKSLWRRNWIFTINLIMAFLYCTKRLSVLSLSLWLWTWTSTTWVYVILPWVPQVVSKGLEKVNQSETFFFWSAGQIANHGTNKIKQVLHCCYRQYTVVPCYVLLGVLHLNRFRLLMEKFCSCYTKRKIK